MIVKNMISDRSGKPIANQFIITIDNLEIFQSYKTVIAVRRDNNDDVILLDYDYSISPTTSRYLYKFLGFNKKRILERVQDNSIRICGLNTDVMIEDGFRIHNYNMDLHTAFQRHFNTVHNLG